MAKVTLSPLITDIRGKVGSSVFSKWKGINTVRGLVTPGNPRTILQKIARGFTYASSKAWARQSDDFKREFNEAASGSGYSGNNLYVQRLQAFNPRFRDFVTTLSAAAAVGDFTLTVTADEPLTSPDYVDSLGIVEGARILIGADPALYDVTAVDRDTGTLTLQQPLAVAAAAGADVMVAGVTAPSGAAWTYRS